MGGSFLLNQLQDIESDLKNKKLFFLTENHITKKAAWIETILLLLVSLILAYWVNIPVFIAVFLFILITGYAYNFKPFEFKNRPFGSLFANALMGWLAFSLGWLAVKEPGINLLIDSLPYLFFNTSLYFFTTLPDMAGDHKSAKNTIAVKHGIQPVILLAAASFLFSVMAGLLVGDYWALLFIIPSIPFYFYAITEKSIKSTIRTTKYAILFFALAICLKIPFYFLLMITIFAGTRWYFKNRFNYNYPNFKGE
jgi:4-hydroxybenzoate polyprenyltransferase